MILSLLTLPIALRPCTSEPPPSTRSQLLEAERRYASLKQHASEAEAAWEEMVGQAEADLEAQAERDGARLAQMSADMGEVSGSGAHALEEGPGALRLQAWCRQAVMASFQVPSTPAAL